MGPKNRCPWTKNTCAHAASKDHFHIVKWALKTNSCEWDKETCSNASKHCHLNILKRARGYGCSWDELFCRHENCDLRMLQWARKMVVRGVHQSALWPRKMVV